MAMRCFFIIVGLPSVPMGCMYPERSAGSLTLQSHRAIFANILYGQLLGILACQLAGLRATSIRYCWLL